MVRSDLKVAKGDLIQARTINRIVDLLPVDEAGFGVGGLGIPRVTVTVKNGSGANRDIGQAMVISGWEGPDGSDPYSVPGSMAFEVDDPTWHTDIARLVVLAEAIPDGERGTAVISGVCLAATTGTDNQFVMIDPASTNAFKTADAGVARVLHKISGEDYTLICLGHNQPLWRYELNENSLAPSDTTVDLVGLDGTVFSTAVELSDPLSLMDDQVTGDEGFCIHVGNKFYAIQGPC